MVRDFRGLSITLGAALAFFSAVAQAAPDGFTCRTSTSRPAEEILVPFGDRDLPRLPAQAVRILPGETLCVTGRLDTSGELVELRLVEQAGENDPPAVMLRLEREEQTMLSVRHSFSKSLDYRAAMVVTRQDLAIPTSTLPVGPGIMGYETWGREVRQLLLFGFQLVSDPPTKVDPPSRPTPTKKPPRPRLPDAEGRMLAVTFGLSVGERRTRFPELNAALVRDGFEPLPTTRVMGGLDMDFTLWRVRVGLGLWAGGASTRHRLTGAEISTWLGELGFTAGFDVLRYEDFTLFAATGITGGNFFVDSRTQGLKLFADRVEPWEGDRVNWYHTNVPLEIGAEYLAPFAKASATEHWAFQFGMRAGWVQQLGGSWETDEKEESREIGGGPEVDLSGPQFRIVLGIGVHNAR